MSAASNYTEQNVLHAMLRGVSFPVPANTYVSLHTADPTDAALPSSEVQLADWPAYVRREAEAGGVIGTGWGAWVDGIGCTNANQLTYPGMNGLNPVQVTHWAVWDAPTGGNMLTFAPLQTSRTLLTGDVFVFDVAALTVNQS